VIKINRIEFFVFWCAVLIQSLVWSRFLLSVSMWGIVIVALFEIPKEKEGKMNGFQWLIEYLQFWHWQSPNLRKIWNLPKILLENRSYLALTIPFFLVLISGLWSENLSYWLSRVQLRLPFLLLPFAFSQIPSLSKESGSTISKKQFHGLLFFFMGIISVNILLVLTNYGLHFKEITTHLGQGKAMPFLKEHITFSIMAAFACIAGIELGMNGDGFQKKAGGLLSLFIFIALHIIAVRTGLIALYLCLILRGLLFVFQSRRYFVGFVGLLGLVSIPLLSYWFLPSFQQKVHYVIWDLEQYAMGDPTAKSDSERLISLNIGKQIFLENKILGVGYGDIEQEMNRSYAQNYPTLTTKLPHNQWLLTAMGMGIVGLLLSLISFITPLIERRRFRWFTFLSLQILVFVFSMTDIPFETSFSLSFFTFFTCLFLNQDA
jgi:O-antigen ligase